MGYSTSPINKQLVIIFEFIVHANRMGMIILPLRFPRLFETFSLTVIITFYFRRLSKIQWFALGILTIAGLFDRLV